MLERWDVAVGGWLVVRVQAIAFLLSLLHMSMPYPCCVGVVAATCFSETVQVG